jgi:hypothetical protein
MTDSKTKPATIQLDPHKLLLLGGPEAGVANTRMIGLKWAPTCNRTMVGPKLELTCNRRMVGDKMINLRPVAKK